MEHKLYVSNSILFSYIFLLNLDIYWFPIWSMFLNCNEFYYYVSNVLVQALSFNLKNMSVPVHSSLIYHCKFSGCLIIAVYLPFFYEKRINISGAVETFLSISRPILFIQYLLLRQAIVYKMYCTPYTFFKMWCS